MTYPNNITKNAIRTWCRRELGVPPTIDRWRFRWRIRCTVSRRLPGRTAKSTPRTVTVRLEARGRTLEVALHALGKGCEANPIVLRANKL